MIKAESPVLCQSCTASDTTLQVPRGMGIVVIQVFIQGPLESSSELATDLLYADPDKLTCMRQSEYESEFCGLIFGQVYDDQVRLSARHASGGENKLEYYLTFQTWASRPSITR